MSMSDLPSLQPAIFLTIDDPSHLTKGFEDYDINAHRRTVSEDAKRVAEVEAGCDKANEGLSLMQRCHPVMIGMELYHHQIDHCQRMYAKKKGAQD